MNIDHLSITQIRMYNRCPAQYSYRYGEGLIAPPAARMVRGRSYHKAAEWYYDDILRTYRRHKPKHVAEKFADHFETSAKNEELVYQEGETKSKLLDSGAALTRLYTERIASKINPAAVELSFTIPTELPSMTFRGRIDLVTRSHTIPDLKMSKRMMDADSIAADLQLTGYSIAYEYIFGRPARNLEFHFALDQKELKVKRVKTYRGNWQKDIFWKMLYDVHAGVCDEHFPRHPDGWWCSPKYCGYYKYCLGGVRR